MAKSIIASVVAVAVAFEDPMVDDGVSLLQMRAHKHETQETQEELQEPEFYLGDRNTMCQEEEIMTFAKCLYVQFNYPSIVKQMGHGLTQLGRQWGMRPTGCIMDNANRMVWNDEPLDQGRPMSDIRPICQKGGGGGRAAELIAQKISCEKESRSGVVEGTHTGKQNGDGCDPGGWKRGQANMGSRRLTWSESSSIVVPKLTLGPKGGVCEDTCALLTLEQCTRASDSGELEQLVGTPVPTGWSRGTPISQHFGPNHAAGSMPSGCSWSGKDTFYFSPLDTPSGALAGPEGEPWLSPSGVGAGWSQAAPICGVCSTTTTTMLTTTPDPPVDGPPGEEEVGDAVAAEGDPHMQTSSGAKFDLPASSLKQ